MTLTCSVRTSHRGRARRARPHRRARPRVNVRRRRRSRRRRPHRAPARVRRARRGHRRARSHRAGSSGTTWEDLHADPVSLQTTTTATATATTTTRTCRARRDGCSADRRTAAASSPPSWTRAARSGCEPTPSGDARCSCATLEGACGSSVRPRAATHRTSGTAGGAIIPDTSSPSIHSPAISTRRAPSAATPAPAPRAACRSYPRT